MELRINTICGTLVLDGKPAAYDQFYPMPDGQHKVIIRMISRYTLMIEINKGKRLVQRATVRFLSAYLGRYGNDEPRQQEYRIHLDPNAPIYPIEDLVNTLLGMGIRYRQIIPVFQNQFSDQIISHSPPKLLSDGPSTIRKLSQNTGKATHLYTVGETASWAILSYGSEVSRIYLKMTADPDVVLGAIEQIYAANEAPRSD